MNNASTTTPIVKGAVPQIPDFHWVGDNIGTDVAEVTVSAKAATGQLIYMSLEEALNKIDRFAEYGANRIISALVYHFSMVPA